MKKILIILCLAAAFLLNAEGFQYYRIERYPDPALDKKDVGGLYVNTVLADSTNEFWTYRVFQDDIDYFGRSCRSITGIEEIPSGFYEVRFPFNHLAYPPITDLQIITGHVTVVQVYISGRAVIASNYPALTFNLYQRETGENIGKNQKVIYASEKLNYDLLPGKYELVIDNMYEDPREKPEGELEEKIVIDFELKPWQILQVDLQISQ